MIFDFKIWWFTDLLFVPIVSIHDLWLCEKYYHLNYFWTFQHVHLLQVMEYKSVFRIYITKMSIFYSIWKSYRRRIAVSSIHGTFVAASTRTPELSVPTPNSTVVEMLYICLCQVLTFHLYQKFGLYASRWFWFIITTLTAQCIDFIDKYNTWLTFSSNFEQTFHAFFTFTKPFW